MLTALILAALAQDVDRRVAVDFVDEPLPRALAKAADAAGVRLELSPEAAGCDAKVNLRVRELSLRSVLKLMVQGRGLAVVSAGGALRVMPKEHVVEATETKIYEVADLLRNLKDFPGPTFELVPSSRRDAPLAGATFALAEEPTCLGCGCDYLSEIIRQLTDGWGPEKAAISRVRDLLIITQTPRTHRAIRRILELLRRAR